MNLIEKHLGHWGKYQAVLFALLFLPAVMNGCITLLFTFTGAVPKHRCRIPGLDSNISASYDDMLAFNNWTETFVYGPVEKEGGKSAHCSFCLKNLEVTAKTYETCNMSELIPCDYGHVYDTSQYKTSLTAQFDLVCGNHWKRDLANSMYMLGLFLGSLVFGLLSDRWGRRPMFLICSLTGVVSFNIVPFLQSFWLICVFQVVNGTIAYGSYLTAYVFLMELISGYYRTACGVAIQAFFTVGYVCVGVGAYFLRRWENLQWSQTAWAVLLIPYYWIIPESVRWLAVRGRFKEAEQVIIKAARFNHLPLDEKALQSDLHKLGVEAANKKTTKSNVSFLSLFRHPALAINTCIVLFTWAANAMTYYGLAFNTDDLPGDDYSNFLLVGCAGFIGYIICIPLMEYLGRKFALVSLLGSGGLACILCAFVSADYPAVIVSLAMFGKMAISGSFAVVYNYSVELYPTVVRQSSTGVSSMFARIGSISAPQVHLLGKLVKPWLPMVLYGLVAIIAALLDLLLPETKGQLMPDTIEESAEFCRSKNMLSRSGTKLVSLPKLTSTNKKTEAISVETHL